ncbi:MAG: hypothetical protein HY040_08785 [Planctomycetes bacterium]|nr:hypothetical protein [Planctomycetota bacterium]MBI3408439.1 hypothetical protein [Planctomycetota bacterium]
MAHLVEKMRQVYSMLSAARAIVLVSVPWSPWPRKSRDVLAALESTQEQWFTDASVEFFDLWPERDDELKRWYESLFANSAPRFQLHGHGYGPLWWLSEGKVLECLTEPYVFSLEALQQRSAAFFHGI